MEKFKKGKKKSKWLPKKKTELSTFRKNGNAKLKKIKKNIIFWNVALCRSWVNRRFGGKYRLHFQGKKNQPPADADSPLADFSTLKTGALCSSEMSVNPGSTQRHIPKDDILHSHRCEYLKSYSWKLVNSRRERKIKIHRLHLTVNLNN
jgi:hypothetical protein